jgi:hypothetical protein|tara:strand:+ start:324 stop:593 length:270 start_codon:yes stop_codon:yes gene_type:complete
LGYAEVRLVLVKKNKSERSQNFKADMKTIKKEDVKKLQETFSQFFGANSREMRKQSSRLRNRIYFFGFAATIIFVVAYYLTKNVKFIGM